MVQRKRRPSEWNSADWDEFVRELRRKAGFLMRRRNVEGLRRRGAPMIGIEPDDLAQHAIECFCAQDPPFIELRQSFYQYCIARMDNKIKAATELLQNRPSEHPFVGIAQTDENDENLHLLINPITPHSILESVELLASIESFLEQRDSQLLKLFRVHVLDGVKKAAEQADSLGVPVETVYGLRARLVTAIEDYFSSEDRA